MKFHLLFFIGLTGIMDMIHAKLWRNWARNQSCNAPVITPKNKQELIDLVKRAKKENKKIHALGSGHSWSDIVCAPNGYLVDISNLHNIIAVNKEKHQVTVEAGIKLHDLNNKLEKLNLSLSNQGAITAQSLAGVISTATHGSGKTGTYSGFVIGVELLTADGELITISATKNKKYLSAVKTAVGALGILTEITLQCEPLFTLKQEFKTTSWDNFIENYEDLLDENDYAQFRWLAGDDSVLMKLHNRVDSEEKNKKKKLRNPYINYAHKLLATDKRLREIYVEIEIAVPRELFVKAAQAARKLILEIYQTDMHYNSILFRFVSQDPENLLSPASTSDVVYFSLIPLTLSGYEQIFKKFYDLLLMYNGRPHWGKINFLTYNHAKKLYGRNLEEFIHVRKQLDPTGLFSNSFTQKIFGW